MPVPEPGIPKISARDLEHFSRRSAPIRQSRAPRQTKNARQTKNGRVKINVIDPSTSFSEDLARKRSPAVPDMPLLSEHERT